MYIIKKLLRDTVFLIINEEEKPKLTFLPFRSTGLQKCPFGCAQLKAWRIVRPRCPSLCAWNVARPTPKSESFSCVQRQLRKLLNVSLVASYCVPLFFMPSPFDRVPAVMRYWALSVFTDIVGYLLGQGFPSMGRDKYAEKYAIDRQRHFLNLNDGSHLCVAHVHFC